MTDRDQPNDLMSDPTHDLTSEAHRATCAACAATWAELDAISAEARRLPLLTPSRDLWSGIESRLGAREASTPRGPITAADGTAPTAPRALTATRRSALHSPMLRYAAAAALLITVTAAVTWRIATDAPPMVANGTDRGTDSGPDVGPAVEAAVASGGLDRSTEIRAASYLQEFSAMDGEISALQALLAERRGQLDSATVRVLEKNLALIDQAIAESRAALAKDPASQFLTAQLARSYSIKLSLLRSTATRPVGT